MRKPTVLVLAMAVLCLQVVSCLPASEGSGAAAKKTWCTRGEACWPTDQDISEFRAKLNPETKRVLKWDGQPHPRVCSVPINSPGDQPLYGWGSKGMDALYYTEEAISSLCFLEVGETRTVCLAGMRNNPLENWHPAMVVWALTSAHVQESVKFAVKHNLCIMVAGTGHDFMNRHSCNDGLLIRTTLLKDISWDLNDARGFGNDGGNVKFGSGIVFSEAQKSASDHGRYVSSGWAITVGIAGWSIGGGHGPFAPSAGLGVDNILEVEMVTADGNLVTANAQQNHDLHWAVRGGGGSTWGVITAFTLKAHVNPATGFAKGEAVWYGTFCSAGRERLHLLIDAYFNWSLTLNKKWSGISFFTPVLSNETQCYGNWTFYMTYVYLGSQEEASEKWLEFTERYPPTAQGGGTKTTWWEFVVDYPLENIIPLPWTYPGPQSAGSVPSVTVSRQKVQSGEMGAQVKLALDECTASKRCQRQELYHDITGQTDSPQDPNVSIGPGFRTAMFHFVVGGWNSTMMEKYYNLGDNSYFSESGYDQPGDSWKSRYWGEENYARLLEIKRKWDPHNAFWCRNCVGSDLETPSRHKPLPIYK